MICVMHLNKLSLNDITLTRIGDLIAKKIALNELNVVIGYTAYRNTSQWL